VTRKVLNTAEKEENKKIQAESAEKYTTTHF